MVMGASPGAGCVSGARDDADVVDSVVVSMCSFALLSSAPIIGNRNPPPRRARTVASSGVWFLFGCAVLNEAGGFYHRSAPSSFQPRELLVAHLLGMVTVQVLQPCVLIREPLEGATPCPQQ